MFVTNNYWVALGLTIMTMITWGSNKIAVKHLSYPVAMYTIDFFTCVFIFHIILGFTIGNDFFPPAVGQGMMSNFKIIFATDTTVSLIKKIGGPILAGISTTAFSLIMFVLTDGYGLTSAIPLLFGAAMLFGVVATYFLEREGKAVLIFSGVAILFGAVILNTVASTMNNRRKNKVEEKPAAEASSALPTEASSVLPTEAPSALPTEAKPVEENAAPIAVVNSVLAPVTAPVEEAIIPAETSSIEIPLLPKEEKPLSMKMFVILGIAGAIFDFFYGPCTSLGKTKVNPVSPYGIFLLVSAASFITVWPCAFIVMRFPLKGPKCTFKEYFHATWKQRWPAIWSAGLLALGNFGYATAASNLGFAISYALSRGTLLVSALWGIIYYKEFNGADCKTWSTQITALICFVTAIVVVAMSAE